MKVVTLDGLTEESDLKWELWREDAGESWTIIHQLRDKSGRVVRRDSWVNFKGNGISTDVEQGEM